MVRIVAYSQLAVQLRLLRHLNKSQSTFIGAVCEKVSGSGTFAHAQLETYD